MSDLISRKAAMDLFMGKPPDYYHSSYIVGEINSLPSEGMKTERAIDELTRKVVDGLKHCLDGAAGCLKGCPYAEEKRCRAKLMQDALDALEDDR